MFEFRSSFFIILLSAHCGDAFRVEAPQIHGKVVLMQQPQQVQLQPMGQGSFRSVPQPVPIAGYVTEQLVPISPATQPIPGAVTQLVPVAPAMIPVVGRSVPANKTRRQLYAQRMTAQPNPSARTAGTFNANGTLIQPLNSVWSAALLGGQLFMATILMVSYSQKYQGRNLTAGETVEVRMPYGSSRHPELVWRMSEEGSTEVVPYIWISHRDHTIYVCFCMQNSNTQQVKNIWKGMSEVEGELIELISARKAGQYARRAVDFEMSGYIADLLIELFGPTYNFGQQLKQTSDLYPGYTVLFAGISHGGTLAQAAALWYVLEVNPSVKPSIFSAGAYRWCDEQASDLMGEVFNEHLLPVAAYTTSPVVMWDSVIGFPRCRSPMPTTMLLNIDQGHFLDADGETDWWGNECPDGPLPMNVPSFANRMRVLHFGDTLIRAMKKVYENLGKSNPTKLRYG